MKRFDTIFLHIGLHKTGSSAIQAMCDQNRQIFSKHDIYYPVGHWHAQLGSCFSKNKTAFVYNRHEGRVDLSVIEASDRLYLEEFEKELRNTSCRTLLLSYEGFIDLRPPEIADLRNFLLSYGTDLKVLAYCRHPVSFAPSEISQRCRMGVPSETDSAQDLPIPKFKDYLQKFEMSFGREAITAADFAIDTLHKRDVRLDFLNRIGIGELQAAEFLLGDARINESLSAEAVCIGQAMARLAPTSRYGNLFFLRYNDILESIKGSPIALSESQRESILEAARPHLDYLTDTFDLKLLEPRSRKHDPLFAAETIESLAKHFLESDTVTQAYRWLLGREPESEDVIYGHVRASRGDWRRMRMNAMQSREFACGVASAPVCASPTAANIQPVPLDPTKRHSVVPCDLVTVCMIVFDEEEMLPHSLAALAPAFSKFIILDMGSSDRTLPIIRTMLGDRAQIVTYDRERLFADGYAAARNVCVDHASSDWILMVDADEVLVRGIDSARIVLDRPVDATDSASIERRNLIKWDGTLPTEGRPIERPRRLYRRGGPISWTGYIHEELRVTPGATDRMANSSLTFNHLTALRDPTRIQYRKNMYAWMLMRAFETPAVRGGTNKWWFDEFLPGRIETIKASARDFVRDPRAAGLTDAARRSNGHPAARGTRAVASATRREVLEKLWQGEDPIADFPHERFEADIQGWNSSHPYLVQSIQRHAPRIIVEIGVWKGASAITMASTIKEAKIDAVVIAVDTWLGAWDHWLQPKWRKELRYCNGYPGIYQTFVANLFKANVEDLVIPLPLDSANASEVLQRARLKVDMIHLDGAHDFATVKADLHRWWPLLTSGGIFIGDDYFTDGKTWQGVRQALDEFIEQNDHKEFKHQNGKCFVVKP